MTLQFDNVQECVDDLTEKVRNKPYGSGFRPKERQRYCAKCKRWKYMDERCNLFVLGRLPREIKQ